ncbi:tetratricopeptide repeat protein [uncultured Microscilla sp.]|uniref:tetratricopeptide repeat protein n=1 Tax=uncultured Microscilla sp. TaxID=432653 RepID=UPI002627822C|nr:tetratricopeptide repeat protein [uncultured Microscilla sp.]
MLYLALFLLQVNWLIAQNQAKIDSLKALLNTHVADTQKVNIYNKLAGLYQRSDSAQVAYYTSLSIPLAKKLHFTQGLSRAYYSLAWVTMVHGHYAAALDLFKQSLGFAQKIANKRGIADAYNGLGIVQMYHSDYTAALAYHKKSLNINIELDDLTGQSYSYNNIGMIYDSQGKYSLAFYYYQKSVAIKRGLGDIGGLAVGYNNIGNIYTADNNQRKALKYYKQSLKLFQKNNDKRVAYIYINLGDTYRKQGNFTKSLEYTRKALQYFQKQQNKAYEAEIHKAFGELYVTFNKNTLALEHLNKALTLSKAHQQSELLVAIYALLGKAYYQQKQYASTIDYLVKGVTLAKANSRWEYLKECALLLAKVYKAEGNYKKASEYQEIGLQATDSVMNTSVQIKLSDFEAFYEYEQEKDSLRLLQKQKQQEYAAHIAAQHANQQITYLGLGLVSILLLSVLFFYRQKQRNNQKLNKANSELHTVNTALLAAKDEVDGVNVTLQEMLETIEKQNDDILDSIVYAQRIQKAVLPLEKRIKEYLPESFVFFKPRDIVSGDFYWFEEVNNKQFIIMADCTGHGVPGAFMTMLGIQALNNIIIQNKIYAPEQILHTLNQTFHTLLNNKGSAMHDGMDVVVSVIDRQAKKMHCAGANSPLIVIQQGKAQEIKGGIHSINGYQRENALVKFIAHTFDISTPTTFYLYSDGFQDQFGGREGKKFMKKRFRELLGSIASQPMIKQRQILQTTLNDWMETEALDGMLPYEQVDDILVIGVRV